MLVVKTAVRCFVTDAVYDIARFTLLANTDVQGVDKLQTRDDTLRRQQDVDCCKHLYVTDSEYSEYYDVYTGTDANVILSRILA